ncbi:MAG: YhdH/YhfP family quinone oxidoreductase [Proteobacteria bacterium]|nr:YhdH/YhfP family quinone oxidoreductase [Pseudomonadota bacterium]MBU1390014.1 YhdH/YhfP family quinone oxidoreductase [Pseudomonadota bacterium]MBU1545035.1 YhdH/YhfP family quinone oxidoreductase [Pseudomonadota bacterium]MBU2480361.1 YhdH/YhfP family quinone oxidoreductase [Pseudomonadota bacterium]
MKNISYTAFVTEESGKNQFVRDIKTLAVSNLPDNDVLIRVQYSSLNYKDALSATGNKGVTRHYPHTPGIDAAGIVEDSRTDMFKKGDKVIVTSYDLGMNTPGGFGQYIRVPENWVVRLPGGLTLKQSMIFGTAGFTAGMSVDRLTRSVAPEDGSILVTGATGGVGSLAAGILAHLGYDVCAVSGKKDSTLLDQLGVKQIIDRNAFLANTQSPLLKEQWAGVIDTVGGQILATAIKSGRQNAVVTCCGNVASFELPVTVFPFILRGVSLIGIDSQHCPMHLRTHIWNKLATDWKFDIFENIFQQISLDQLDYKIRQMLKGTLQGRTIVGLD